MANDVVPAVGGGGPWMITEGPVDPGDVYNRYAVCYLCGGPATEIHRGGNYVCGQHAALVTEADERRLAQLAIWAEQERTEVASAPSPSSVPG